jgi:hypothetical protein
VIEGDAQGFGGLRRVLRDVPGDLLGALGSEALDLAARQQVAPNLQDVRRLRMELEPWRTTRAVRELDDQLALAG